jgi:uncharacterized membrane protein YphA (DoxX/SURF4 family)
MTKEFAKPPERTLGVSLLLLRIGAGLSLCVFFGAPKLKAATYFIHSGQWAFVDFNRKLGLPFPIALAWIQTLNESVSALLVAFGFVARCASGILAIAFIIATVCSLRAGEEAWLTAGYLALIFATLTLTGPGTLSIDFMLKKRRATKTLKEMSS